MDPLAFITSVTSFFLKGSGQEAGNINCKVICGRLAEFLSLFVNLKVNLR